MQFKILLYEPGSIWLQLREDVTQIGLRKQTKNFIGSTCLKMSGRSSYTRLQMKFIRIQFFSGSLLHTMLNVKAVLKQAHDHWWLSATPRTTTAQGHTQQRNESLCTRKPGKNLTGSHWVTDIPNQSLSLGKLIEWLAQARVRFLVPGPQVDSATPENHRLRTGLVVVPEKELGCGYWEPSEQMLGN